MARRTHEVWYCDACGAAAGAALRYVAGVIVVASAGSIAHLGIPADAPVDETVKQIVEGVGGAKSVRIDGEFCPTCLHAARIVFSDGNRERVLEGLAKLAEKRPIS